MVGRMQLAELNAFLEKEVVSLNPGGRLPVQPCVLCQGANTVFGNIVYGKGRYPGYFVPDGVPWYRLTSEGVETPGHAFACRDCAAVSTVADREQLGTFLDRYCRKPA